MQSYLLIDRAIKNVLTAYPTTTPDALALLVIRDLDVHLSYWTDARCFALVSRIRQIAEEEPFKYTKRTKGDLP
jgi:hypothetical protein